MASAFETDSFDYARVMGGEIVELFSARGGKRVEHVIDGGGDFVRRVYEPSGINTIEQCNRPFVEAWDVYTQMIGDAGIAMVDSCVVTDPSGHNPVIVCEFIDAEPVDALPTSQKVELVGNLARSLASHTWFLPAPEGLAADGFVAVGQQPVLLDVDPYIKPRHTGLGPSFDRDASNAITIAMINRIAENIQVWAGDTSERTAMAAGATHALSPIMPDTPPLDLIQHFSYLVNMANGYSLEETRQAWRS